MLLVGLALGCQPARPSVTVEWTTASEVDNAGFNLYRSLAAEGPYEKVNQALIPAAARSVTGARYAYTDRAVAEGKTYWYRLEDVGLDGKVTVHQPVQVVAQSGGGNGPLWLVGGLAALTAASSWLAVGALGRRLPKRGAQRLRPESRSSEQTRFGGGIERWGG